MNMMNEIKTGKKDLFKLVYYAKTTKQIVLTQQFSYERQIKLFFFIEGKNNA